MIGLLIAAAAAAVPVAPPPALNEAEHALTAGRLDQARTMIGEAIKAGVRGPELDRLLASLAFEAGDFQQALARYEALLAAEPANTFNAQRAGIAAIKVKDLDRASAHLDRAVSSPNASWRAWNARGVVADYFGNWKLAERAYARASKLAPDQPEVLNNMGWSLLLRGEWELAVDSIERAVALDPKSSRMADNLELARAAKSSELPRRRSGESDEQWSARLNDAGVLASLQGDQRRAIAAFTQALEARDRWFDRAANNLEMAEGRL